MISDAELQLAVLGHVIEEHEFGRENEPDVIGLVEMGFTSPGRYTARIIIRPGTSPDTRERFAEWVLEKMFRMSDHGPEPDGWQKREADDRWQLWGREDYLPPLD